MWQRNQNKHFLNLQWLSFKMYMTSRHCNNQDKLPNSCQRPRLGTKHRDQSLQASKWYLKCKYQPKIRSKVHKREYNLTIMSKAHDMHIFRPRTRHLKSEFSYEDLERGQGVRTHSLENKKSFGFYREKAIKHLPPTPPTPRWKMMDPLWSLGKL